MKRIKIAIIILTIILAVSGAIFGISYYINDKREKEEKAEQERLVMFDFDSDSVEKIEIEGESGNYTIEYNDNDGWILTDGDEFALNDSAITSISSTMSQLKAAKIIENPDTSKYGFDNPTKIISHIGDETYTLLIGNATPTYENFYAMKENDDTVYLIEYSDGLVLDANKNTLKDTYFYDYSTYEVKRISLWHGAKTDENIAFELEMGNDESWAMSKPSKNADIDLTAINEFLIDSSKDQVYSFVQENCTEADYAKYGFDNPSHVFEISSGDETMTMIFGNATGNEEGEIYALFVEQGQVVTVLENEVSLLGYNTLDIMKTSIFTEYIDKVSEVQISLGGNDIVMNFFGNDGSYLLGNKNITEMGEEAVSAYVNFFNSYNNAYFTAEETEAEATPEGEAEVTLKYTTTESFVIDIAYIPVPNSDRYYAMANDAYTGFTIDGSVIDEMTSAYEKLVETTN